MKCQTLRVKMVFGKLSLGAVPWMFLENENGIWEKRWHLSEHLGTSKPLFQMWSGAWTKGSIGEHVIKECYRAECIQFLNMKCWNFSLKHDINLQIFCCTVFRRVLGPFVKRIFAFNIEIIPREYWRMNEPLCRIIRKCELRYSAGKRADLRDL